MSQPTLSPIAPAPGAPIVLGSVSPFWIGGAHGSGLQLVLPGVADRHVALVEREDGWWASAGNGATTLNGRALAGLVRLAPGDVLEVAAGYRYEFGNGVAAAAPAAPPPAMPAGRATRRKRPKRARVPGTGRSPLVIAIVAGIVLLVLGAGAAIWFGAFRADHSEALLTDAQAQRFDSLLVAAYDHIERGNTLLELGLSDAAATEFARGVNTLGLSDLRNHPSVKPRIEALEASVAAIYRDRRLAVPRAYARAASLPPEKLRAASLSVEQFAAAFGQVVASFQARFGDGIDVTGRDHAEHLSLYGPGGALDLRTRTMSPAQLQFVIAEARSRGIRVKDFSQDSILQRQIQAATKAGLLDRAGTGLHLHVDRFADRRDKWTVN